LIPQAEHLERRSESPSFMMACHQLLQWWDDLVEHHIGKMHPNWSRESPNSLWQRADSGRTAACI